jgi:hypothetical protein
MFSAFGNEAFLPDYVLKGEDLTQSLGGGGFPRDTPEQCQAGVYFTNVLSKAFTLLG